MSIGIRLRAERERLGMTQVECAQFGHVGKQSQLKYEQGIFFPNAQYLASLASLGVDV